MTRTFIIDTDTASDDAVALLMAFRAADVRVAAVTVVAGNVPVEQGARNALYTAELCGADVPVYKGAEKPLARPYQDAEWFHGRDGLGDQNYPPPRRQAESEHAVPALIRHITQNAGCTLVTLGPLTNIALALAQAPHIAQLVERCIVMGGAATTYGNVTPAAEYNIWCDPEADRSVFLSGLPIEMVGWELCIGPYAFDHQEIEQMRAIGTPYAHFAVDCNRVAIEALYVQTGQRALALPDPTAMAVALDPTICTRQSEHYVLIETSSALTRGMTVVDRLNVAEDARNRHIWGEAIAKGVKTKVCWELDVNRWKNLLYSLLR
jgi:purine nucleosidase